jgi:hypothetical protein
MQQLFRRKKGRATFKQWRDLFNGPTGSSTWPNR